MAAPTTTKLSVDRPGPHERPVAHDGLTVEGWAWSAEGDPEVTVTVGGRRTAAGPGVWRKDVSDTLGIGPHRGYRADVSLADLPGGTTELLVTATGPDGVPVEVRRTIIVGGASGAEVPRLRPFGGFSERLDPSVSPGTMVHVEHVARYRWVAPLAVGRRVLDAACGTGYGSAILGDAGASSVHGVDTFAAAILAAREQDRFGAEFTLGDLRQLPFADDQFDLVVCFEAIEHVLEQQQVLAELRRVLAPGGILAMSTPIAGAISVHNHHHLRELSPIEFEALLRGTFAHVSIVAQHSAITSLIDARAPHRDPPPLAWTSGPAEPLYVVALASDAAIEPPPACGAVGAGTDVAQIISDAYATADSLSTATAQAAAYEARALRAESAYEVLEEAHADALARLAAAHGPRGWRVPQPLRDRADALRSLGRR